MQHIKVKKGLCAVFAAFTAIVSAFVGPQAVSAETQQGALGTQKPAISAAYMDDLGTVYDGNALQPGSYDMVISVSDLYSIAQLGFTASYQEDLLSFDLLGEELLSDTAAYADEMNGAVMDRLNGTFSFFLVTENPDKTVLSDNGADLLTIGITVKGDAPVDMQDVITVNTDPNLTFIDVDYGDTQGDWPNVVFDCYALSAPESYQATVYPMTCDLSPDLTQYYTVSAYIGALAAPDDAFGTYATTGATVSIQTEDGTPISAVTDSTGKFVLEKVPNGTYIATVTYKYAFTRTFTIIVDGADIESDTMVGIVACNWDGNSSVNIMDYSFFVEQNGKTINDDSYDVGYNLDRNTSINIIDYSIYAEFVGFTAQSMENIYAETILT